MLLNTILYCENNLISLPSIFIDFIYMYVAFIHEFNGYNKFTVEIDEKFLVCREFNFKGVRASEIEDFRDSRLLSIQMH